MNLRQEYRDRVVIDSGLKAGETVATTGSLLLDQMYDDLATTHAVSTRGESVSKSDDPPSDPSDGEVAPPSDPVKAGPAASVEPKP